MSRLMTAMDIIAVSTTPAAQVCEKRSPYDADRDDRTWRPCWDRARK